MLGGFVLRQRPMSDAVKMRIGRVVDQIRVESQLDYPLSNRSIPLRLLDFRHAKSRRQGTMPTTLVLLQQNKSKYTYFSVLIFHTQVPSTLLVRCNLKLTLATGHHLINHWTLKSAQGL
jgi:hypothetical protein